MRLAASVSACAASVAKAPDAAGRAMAAASDQLAACHRVNYEKLEFASVRVLLSEPPHRDGMHQRRENGSVRLAVTRPGVPVGEEGA